MIKLEDTLDYSLHVLILQKKRLETQRIKWLVTRDIFTGPIWWAIWYISYLSSPDGLQMSAVRDVERGEFYLHTSSLYIFSKFVSRLQTNPSPRAQSSSEILVCRLWSPISPLVWSWKGVGGGTLCVRYCLIYGRYKDKRNSHTSRRRWISG